MHPPMRYMVVRKRDTEPFEVTLFATLAEVQSFYERASEQWTETYMLAVMAGPKGCDMASHAPPPRDSPASPPPVSAAPTCPSGCGGLLIPMCVNCCGPHRAAPVSEATFDARAEAQAFCRDYGGLDPGSLLERDITVTLSRAFSAGALVGATAEFVDFEEFHGTALQEPTPGSPSTEPDVQQRGRRDENA